MNILLTGGHGATTAISVIDRLKKRFPNAMLSWIGSSKAISGSNVTSLEYKTYPNLGVKYYSINAGKLQTKFTRYTIPLILLIPVGFFQVFFLILKIKPKITLSFGGFASVPVVFWSWLLGIPVILHEQTVAAGRASRLSALFADKIALARGESLKYFPKDKCVIVGNPILREIIKLKPKQHPGNPKTLLVMGGSRGSEFINEEITKIINKLVKKYRVVHITGERDFPKYNKNNVDNYQVLSFVDPEHLADIYAKSDLIISRSGANSVSEILYIKRPSILIPLPRTYMDEQVKNAKFAENAGIAMVMTEQEVNPNSLLNAIEQMFADWQQIVFKFNSYKNLDLHAAEKIVELLSGYI